LDVILRPKKTGNSVKKESVDMQSILWFALELVKMKGGKMSLATAVKEVKKAIKEAE
jgi:hypothetical protein